MPWIGLELTSLDALDDVCQHIVGAASYSDLLALAHDQPLRNSISVRRPFCISWPIEGRCSAAVRLLCLKRSSSQVRIAASSPSPARAIISGGKW